MNIKKSQLKKFIKTCIREAMDSAQMLGHRDTSGIINRMDEFTRSYITTALWSSTDNLDDSGGRPLEDKYGFDDIESNTLERMIHDCKKFQADYSQLYEKGGWDDSLAGHDFWLTRNGHGSGFWDKYSKGDDEHIIGVALSKAAKSFGTFDLYLGDGPYDGLIVGS